MRRSKRILILHKCNGYIVPSLGELISALRALGAEVNVRRSDGHFDEILDDIEQADSLLFWN